MIFRISEKLSYLLSQNKYNESFSFVGTKTAKLIPKIQYKF